MSIDRRLPVSDNLGWQPCIDPVALGRLMDRLCEGRGPSRLEQIRKAITNLRRRLLK